MSERYRKYALQGSALYDLWEDCTGASWQGLVRKLQFRFYERPKESVNSLSDVDHATVASVTGPNARQLNTPAKSVTPPEGSSLWDSTEFSGDTRRKRRVAAVKALNRLLHPSSPRKKLKRAKVLEEPTEATTVPGGGEAAPPAVDEEEQIVVGADDGEPTDAMVLSQHWSAHWEAHRLV